MRIVLIAAIGENYELGKDNHLIWSLPGDLRFFKEKTWDQVIVMGKNTFLSLPRLLPHRKHVVLTSSDLDLGSGAEVYHSVSEFLKAYQSYEKIFVIGGASVYQSFIGLANEMYLTHIHDSYCEADVYFPRFNVTDWDTALLGSYCDQGIHYDHVYYKRR